MEGRNTPVLTDTGPLCALFEQPCDTLDEQPIGPRGILGGRVLILAREVRRRST